MGYGFFGGKIICPSAPVLGINNDKSLSMLVQSYGMIIPISTGGGGVFSTSSPVNGSELQNRASHYLETW